jgi:thiamine-phosphate pyrophosphorylase
LYFVSDDSPGGRPLADVLPRALAGGVDVFQLRMKNADDEAILVAAEIAKGICMEHDVPFILNDRPDLALQVGADGVHVGQEDMTLDDARRAAAGLIVGRSTHDRTQIAAAAEADYFAVGPVYETPTKPGRASVGTELIAHAAAAAGDTPWFAIGGIDETTVTAVRAAGAERIVIVRAIADATDPETAARNLRAAICQ